MTASAAGIIAAAFLASSARAQPVPIPPPATYLPMAGGDGRAPPSTPPSPGGAALSPASGDAGLKAHLELMRLQQRWEEDLGFVRGLDGKGLLFPDIFQRLCERTLRRPSDRPSSRDIFEPLHMWVQRGGKPAIQGRIDSALHFIYAGWLAAKFSPTVARVAAFDKEVKDAFDSSGGFDLDDLAISYFGADWVARASGARVAPWADGRRRLDALPRLDLGRLPAGGFPRAKDLAAVERWVERARAP